jgi:hypothetical protein
MNWAKAFLRVCVRFSVAGVTLVSSAADDSARAASSSYICTIETYQYPGDENPGDRYLGELALETTVAIDRRTGATIHPVLGNTSFRKTTVLNAGSNDWSFKVLSESGTGSGAPVGGHVIYVEVEEWAEGFRKPFLAVAQGIAFLGYCE